MKIPSKTNNQLKAVMNKTQEMVVSKMTMTMGQLNKTETKMVQKIVEKQMRVALAMSKTEIQTLRVDKIVKYQMKEQLKMT